MDKKEFKVMHGVYEIAGQNSYSVQGLKAIGIDAESILYFEHPFKYPYDRCFHMDASKKILFPYYALKGGMFFVYALAHYNIFHFHFGRSILNNIELAIYAPLGKKIFFEYHGSDLRDYKKYCLVSGTPFEPDKQTPLKLHRRNDKICKKADGIIVHDDELLSYLPKGSKDVFVVPLRMDVSSFVPVYPENQNEMIRVVHAPSRRAGKGTEYVLEVITELKKKYSNIELVLVEGKTQQEAFEIYKTADIIIDQLFTGTYGVFAIESMALGKPVITYISDEMQKRLPEDLPIVSGNIHTLKDALIQLIENPALRVEKGKKGRLYVENYHDYRVIARILADIYAGKSLPKSGREAFAQVKQMKMENDVNVQ